jgi:sulfoxide reductase heme-binding subunit YedZ
MTVGVLWLVSRAAGIIALVLLTATVVLGTLSTAPTRSASWPRWARQALHRDLALLSVGTLLVHVSAVVLDSFVDIRWYVAVLPFTSSYKPLWVGLGTLAFDLILVVIATSLLRVRLGFKSWRAVHWLVYAAWPIAVLHYLTTGTDAGASWGIALAVIAIGAVVAAVGVRLRQATSPDRALAPAARTAARPSARTAARTAARPSARSPR